MGVEEELAGLGVGYKLEVVAVAYIYNYKMYT